MFCSVFPLVPDAALTDDKRLHDPSAGSIDLDDMWAWAEHVAAGKPTSAYYTHGGSLPAAGEIELQWQKMPSRQI